MSTEVATIETFLKERLHEHNALNRGTTPLHDEWCRSVDQLTACSCMYGYRVRSERFSLLQLVMAVHTRSEADRCDECFRPFPCRTLRILARAYDQHSDYRPEWNLE